MLSLFVFGREKGFHLSRGIHTPFAPKTWFQEESNLQSPPISTFPWHPYSIRPQNLVPRGIQPSITLDFCFPMASILHSPPKYGSKRNPTFHRPQFLLSRDIHTPFASQNLVPRGIQPSIAPDFTFTHNLMPVTMTHSITPELVLYPFIHSTLDFSMLSHA